MEIGKNEIGVKHILNFHACHQVCFYSRKCLFRWEVLLKNLFYDVSSMPSYATFALDSWRNKVILQLDWYWTIPSLSLYRLFIRYLFPERMMFYRNVGMLYFRNVLTASVLCNTSPKLRISENLLICELRSLFFKVSCKKVYQ